MKVDTYLLGHWPWAGAAYRRGGRARRCQPTDTKQRAELVRQNPGWRAAGTSGPPGGQRWSSVAVFSIEWQWIGATVCLKCPGISRPVSVAPLTERTVVPDMIDIDGECRGTGTSPMPSWPRVRGAMRFR